MFPVVADPSFSLGWDWKAGNIAYWKYHRTETRDLANRSYAGVTALSFSICTLMPNFAGRAGCAYLVATRFEAIARTARAASAQGRCLWMVVPTTNVVANLWYFKTYNQAC